MFFILCPSLTVLSDLRWWRTSQMEASAFRVSLGLLCKPRPFRLCIYQSYLVILLTKNMHVFNSSNWSTPTKKTLGLAPNIWFFWGTIFRSWAFGQHHWSGYKYQQHWSFVAVSSWDISDFTIRDKIMIFIHNRVANYSFYLPMLTNLQAICIKLLMLEFFWELPFSRDFNILGCNCKYYIPPSSSSPSKPIL